MNEPPTKRQRMTEEVSNSTETDSAVQELQIDPTTPTRRKSLSYASPTKASLARSYPNILGMSPARSVMESRGKTLRAELLRKRPNGVGASDLLESAVEPIPQQLEVHHESQVQSLPQPSDNRDGFTTTTIESTPAESHDQPLVEHQQPRSPKKTPLSSRELRSFFSGSRRRSRADGVTHDLIVPKLVSRSESLPERSSRSQSTEPELPPTPVQLGISPAPDRPRGLFSSSSMGSRSEGGRHRRRIGRGTSAITSSPLKPRDGPRVLPPPSTSTPDPDPELEPDVAEEAPESDLEEELDQIESVSTQEVQTKKATLVELEHDLDRCRQHTSKLEALTDAFAKNDKVEIDNSTMNALLGDVGESAINATVVTEDANALPYLNLFAPGNLTLTHTTVSRHIKSRPQMTHKLTLTAPPPWPPEMLQLSFDVLVDTGEEIVESIIQSKPGQFYKHKALQIWIEKRLEHSLCKHNISELVWGAGQYFEACVHRAKILKNLSQKYGREIVYANEAGLTGKLTPREALVLSHYMDISEVSFSSGASTELPGASALRRILVTYDLNLSWIGKVTHDIDISITGVNAKAERGAKSLFNKLLAYENVVSAFDSVWKLLEFNSVDTDNLSIGKDNEQGHRSGRAVPAL